jgi:hypothetical protein
MHRRKTGGNLTNRVCTSRFSVALAFIAATVTPVAVSVQAQAQSGAKCAVRVRGSQRWGQDGGIPGFNQQLYVENLGTETIYNPIVTVTTADQITGGWGSFNQIETWPGTFNETTGQTTRNGVLTGNPNVVVNLLNRPVVGGFTLIGTGDTPPTYTCTPGVPRDENPLPPVTGGPCTVTLTGTETWNGSQSGTIRYGGYNQQLRVANTSPSTINNPVLTINLPANHRITRGWGPALDGITSNFTPEPTTIQVPLPALTSGTTLNNTGFTVEFTNEFQNEPSPRPTYSCTPNGTITTTTPPTTPPTTVELTTTIEAPVTTVELTTTIEAPVTTVEFPTTIEAPVTTVEFPTTIEAPVTTVEFPIEAGRSAS